MRCAARVCNNGCDNAPRHCLLIFCKSWLACNVCFMDTSEKSIKTCVSKCISNPTIMVLLLGVRLPVIDEIILRLGVIFEFI